MWQQHIIEKCGICQIPIDWVDCFYHIIECTKKQLEKPKPKKIAFTYDAFLWVMQINERMSTIYDKDDGEIKYQLSLVYRYIYNYRRMCSTAEDVITIEPLMRLVMFHEEIQHKLTNQLNEYPGMEQIFSLIDKGVLFNNKN